MGWVGVYWGETIDLATTTNILVWIVNGDKYCYLEHKIRTTTVTGTDKSVKRDTLILIPFLTMTAILQRKRYYGLVHNLPLVRSIRSLDWFTR